MSKFSTCNNGHNYDSSLFSACPYCPVINENETDFNKTLSDFNKTLAYSNSLEFDKTISNENINELSKTIGVENNTGQSVKQPETEQRNLVGWLITIEKNEQFGQDYKLYTGKNKVGSAAICDILINDMSVSGEHMTIFFHDNEFIIQDNFSTNGTKVNGVLIREVKLKEGDKLKIGNTQFKFKTIF